MKQCPKCKKDISGMAAQAKYCSRTCLNAKRYDDPEFRVAQKAATADWTKRRRRVVGGHRRLRGAKTIYRSGMEERLMPPVLAAGGTYESHRFLYTGKPRGYTPDFILPNGIVGEIKGWFPAKDRTKMLLIREQYPDLDLRMVLATPHSFITNRKIMTQAQWCDKAGIKWADNEIPTSWLHEPKNWNSLANISAAIRVVKKADAA